MTVGTIRPYSTFGACPTCDAEVIIEWDAEEGRAPWVHEVWRTCGCPMPERLSDYDNRATREVAK